MGADKRQGSADGDGSAPSGGTDDDVADAKPRAEDGSSGTTGPPAGAAVTKGPYPSRGLDARFTVSVADATPGQGLAFFVGAGDGEPSANPAGLGWAGRGGVAVVLAFTRGRENAVVPWIGVALKADSKGNPIVTRPVALAPIVRQGSLAMRVSVAPDGRVKVVTDKTVVSVNEGKVPKTGRIGFSAVTPGASAFEIGDVVLEGPAS